MDKLDKLLDEIAPIKETCIKNNTKVDSADEDIYQGIKAWDKLFKKFQISWLHTNNIKFKTARNRLQNFIAKKLNDNIAKPKELWKTLKSLTLHSERESQSNICLNTNGTVSFDAKKNVEAFKTYFEVLATELINKLPNPTNTFGMGKCQKLLQRFPYKG